MNHSLRIANVNIWVFDQDVALDFYVGTLGFEVTTDTDLGFMRWITVHPAGQPDVNFILCNPTAVMSPDNAELVRRALAEGVGGGPQLTTDDCQGLYEDLLAKGVTFSSPPTNRGYGVDTEIVDPFGNRLRIVQATAF